MKSIPKAVAAVLLFVTTSAGSGADANELRPQRVGYTALEYLDRDRNRPLQVMLWYPAEDGAHEAPVSYDRAFKGHAAAEAPYKTGTASAPLVVLSHGDGGSNLDQSWLAEILAANGYIVAAVAHWKNTWKDNEPEATVRVWERPKDLAFLIDRLIADPTWGRRIDASRIAAAGHSSGGYAALALAGAVYSPVRMAEYCTGPDHGRDCALADNARIDRIDFSQADRVYRDERVRAVFAMAPALGPGMKESSLRSITVPVHVVAAQHDEVLPVRFHAQRYASHIPSARLTHLPSGGHFVFMPECTFVATLFLLFHDYDICGLRAGTDRAALHVQIAREALAFLGESLDGKRLTPATR